MATLRSFFLIGALAPALLGAQNTRREIVRGRITSDSGRAVTSADVIVTRIADRVAKTTKSAADGTYQIDWPDGSGDYAVTVSANGFQPRSVHAVRVAAADSVIVADVRLSAQATGIA